jgi:hypothetical protein
MSLVVWRVIGSPLTGQWGCPPHEACRLSWSSD